MQTVFSSQSERTHNSFLAITYIHGVAYLPHRVSRLYALGYGRQFTHSLAQATIAFPLDVALKSEFTVGMCFCPQRILRKFTYYRDTCYKLYDRNSLSFFA
jgi:hypothetical protein